MGVFICPNCQEIYVRDHMSGDFVHECNSGQSDLDNDSLVVIGTAVDGVAFNPVSGGQPTDQAWRAGTSNKVLGEAGNHVFLDDYNVKGDKSSIHRLRQHFEHIEKP